MVSNDTGPLHLARALNTPTVGIFWCINSITGLAMTTDLHRTHISWQISCPHCGLSSRKFETIRNGCSHQTSFVIDIGEDEVLGSVNELIIQLKEMSVADTRSKEHAA
jgi:ADP-heptose:LPS heptosyltransferase